MSVHAPKKPETCRKCGALVAPQTVQCRRCNRYRGAGPIENALLHALVPQSVNAFAATALLGVTIVLWELIVVIATRGDALPAASSATLIQFGATNGPHMVFGQWWRAATSIFLHHSVLHLLMNLYALVIVGRLLEQMSDRYRVLSVFLLGGIASMAISHGWYALGLFGRASFAYTSAGASGGISALIGASYFAARRHLHTEHIAKSMLNWSLFMLVFGLFVSGINNAAHIGGWVVGALFTEVILVREYLTTRITKVVSGLCLVVVAGSFALAALSMWGMPSYAPNSVHDRQSMILPGKKGVTWARSDEAQAWDACRRHVETREIHDGTKAQEVLRDCTWNVRLNPYQPGAWRMLELAYAGAGHGAKAQAAARTARAIAR